MVAESYDVCKNILPHIMCVIILVSEEAGYYKNDLRENTSSIIRIN